MIKAYLFGLWPVVIAWLAGGGHAEWSRGGEGYTFLPGDDANLQGRYRRFTEALESSA